MHKLLHKALLEIDRRGDLVDLDCSTGSVLALWREMKSNELITRKGSEYILTKKGRAILNGEKS